MAACEELRHLRARHGPGQLRVRKRERELTLVRLERRIRPVHLDARTGEGRRAQDRLEPFRRRVAAEHEHPQLLADRGLGARELAEVDAVADAPDLRRAERKRPLVDGDDARAQALGDADDHVALPMRVPEDERDSAQPNERSGEHGVERDHVRDDAERPPA